ncbi:MAG: flippase [Candidatus Fermentibacteraceae bacterium]
MIREMLSFRGKMVRRGAPALVSRGSLALWGLFSILIVRALPTEAYAAYAVARSVQIFAMMLGGGFVMQAIVKHVAEGDTRRERRFTNAAIVLALGIAGLIGALLLSLGSTLQSFYSDIDLRGIPWAIALLVVTSASASLPHSILQAKQKMVRMMTADVSSVLVRIAVVGYFLLTESLTSPLQVFGAMILGNLISTAVGGVFAWPHIEPSLGFDRRELGKLFGFSVVTLGAGLASSIYARTDILLLGKLAPEREVSGYSACRTLTALADTLNNAAKLVVLPVISRMWTSGRRSGVLHRVMGAVMVVSLIQLPLVVGFVFFPRRILNFLFEGKYDAAAPVLMILGILMVFKPLGSMFGCMSAAVGKPSYALYSVIVSATVNVGLNIVLIPRYGAVGAAIATAFSVILGGAAVMVLSLRKLRREA